MKAKIALWLSKMTPMDAFAMLCSLTVAAVTVGSWLLWSGSAFAKLGKDVESLQNADLVITEAIVLERTERKEDSIELKDLLKEVRDNQVRLMIAFKVKPE